GDLGTTERFNRSVAGFDPNATLSVTAAALANFAAKPVAGVSSFNPKGGLLFEGQNGSAVYNTKRGYFSPRFGVAWTPGGRGTVIRAGAGVFVASIGTQGINA